jgi:hypothetical protein
MLAEEQSQLANYNFLPYKIRNHLEIAKKENELKKELDTKKRETEKRHHFMVISSNSSSSASSSSSSSSASLTTSSSSSLSSVSSFSKLEISLNMKKFQEVKISENKNKHSIRHFLSEQNTERRNAFGHGGIAKQK